MRRYLTLLGVQLRASTALALQYRVEFLGDGALALFWAGWSLVPLVVVYGHRPSVAGWSFDEALVVMGWFTVMKGILEGAVNPSLASVVEHIRKGTLDFVLLFTVGATRVTHDPLLLALFPVTVLGAGLLTFLAMAVVGSLSFYLESATSIFEIWMGLFGVFSGYLVPLELFPPWVTTLARALPFRYMLAFPVEMVIGMQDRSRALAELGVQWLFVGVLAVGATGCWRLGLRRFAAYGG